MSALGDAVGRGPSDELARSLRDMIRNGSRMMPRSQQKALGPSEVGHPCPRKLAYGLMDEPGEPGFSDPLPSLIGTAFHTWLEWAAAQHNTQLGYERWLPETKVTVREGLSGTCDLYDCNTDTVVDHKIVGKSSYDTYTRHGPSSTYRAQVHLYGAGYRNLGFDVKNVAIHFIPRTTAQLHKTHVWSEPYNQALVDSVLARLDAVTLLIEAFDVERNPNGYMNIPTMPETCRFCRWWSPDADGSNPLRCNGKTSQEQPGTTEGNNT